jgi:hypothetical protein
VDQTHYDCGKSNYLISNLQQSFLSRKQELDQKMERQAKALVDRRERHRANRSRDNIKFNALIG